MWRLAKALLAPTVLIALGGIAFAIGATQANLTQDPDRLNLAERARAIVHGRAACAGVLSDVGAQIIGIDPARPRLLQVDFTCDGVHRGLFTRLDGSPIR